jgi:hypothetical protein
MSAQSESKLAEWHINICNLVANQGTSIVSEQSLLVGCDPGKPTHIFASVEAAAEKASQLEEQAQELYHQADGVMTPHLISSYDRFKHRALNIRSSIAHAKSTRLLSYQATQHSQLLAINIVKLMMEMDTRQVRMLLMVYDSSN